MTRESLMVIPEYVTLYKKATEENDVEAMLNIAVGFLQKKIEWNDTMLINMPGVKHRGKYYTQANAFDVRYYSWIQSAVLYASEQWKKGEYVSMKYIATAIWEFYLYFAYDWILRKPYVERVEEEYDSNTRRYCNYPIYIHYNTAVSPLWNINTNNRGSTLDKVIPFTRWFFTHFSGDIIANVHEDANIDTIAKIRYLTYCWWSLRNSERYSEQEVIELKEDFHMFDHDGILDFINPNEFIRFEPYRVFTKFGEFYRTSFRIFELHLIRIRERQKEVEEERANERKNKLTKKWLRIITVTITIGTLAMAIISCEL